MALFFVDVEATGLDLENDRIIQLALIKKDGDTIESYSDLCYTDLKMSYSAMGVHNITPEMIEDKYWPYETDSYMALEKGNVESNYFVSHGNELDIAMLENEGMELKMKRVDTDKCSRHLLKDAEDYKLQTLRYQYGLYKVEKDVAKSLGIGDIKAHDALSDVLWHYLLCELLLERVDGGIDKLVELTETPVLLEKITFGKYKNKNMTFEELFATDPADFVWMYNNIAKNWPDLEYTVEHWLKTNPHYWNMAREERKKSSWFD
ncbi:Exodeoxyribonuclease X [hydrothermal vent metagenome]|uniref:Exodeoxyribonuclease X n=1 Tax=hydrothermal vent metagenome TaxID=652676 RepID=A0A1W1BAG5_9ZZZZ